MDTASFAGFLKTLCIIIVAYYAFKFAMRYLLPLVVYKVAKKAEHNFQQRQQNYYQQNNSYTSNDVNTSKENNEVPKSTKVVGEYIEFEEIEEK
ncbi:DUF4834 family protein [Myroides injenensis]|uniref:DUF4834 family protein n=1 Tax=Myroides injenensis TaxID=1183151 RepID=UPI000288739C|nr:DUF4834 family protein [Myroides injenensis]